MQRLAPGLCRRRPSRGRSHHCREWMRNGAVQLLNVVPADQPALRVAHQIDALARMMANELLDPLSHDASQFLNRPRVEPAEEPAEVDVMSPVS